MNLKDVLTSPIRWALLGLSVFIAAVVYQTIWAPGNFLVASRGTPSAPSQAIRTFTLLLAVPLASWLTYFISAIRTSRRGPEQYALAGGIVLASTALVALALFIVWRLFLPAFVEQSVILVTEIVGGFSLLAVLGLVLLLLLARAMRSALQC